MKLTPSNPRQWTVLVYNAGASNAGMSCTHNLLDMERVGSDDTTQVVCMNARTPWLPEQAGLWRDYTGARTYALGPGTGKPAPTSELGKAWAFATTSPADIKSEEIAPRSDPNMADPQTLKAFLLDNLERYPAQHVAVIIGGHGAGFAGQASGPDGRMSNEALAGVLKDVQTRLGKKIDLVDFNNCYGSSLEVIHPLQGIAEVAVGSQSVQWGPTQPLGDVLQKLQAQLKEGKEVTGRELGMLFVDAARSQPLGNLSTRTLTAVDIDALPRVADSLAFLHQTLMDERIPPAQIREWLSKTEKDDYATIPRTIFNYDLVSFATTVQQSTDNAKVKAAAESVAQATRACVLAEQHSDPSRSGLVELMLTDVFQADLPDSPSGLSIHYDANVNARGNRLDDLKNTALGKQLKIEPFLRYVSQDVKPTTRLQALGYDLKVADYRRPWLRPAVAAATVGALALAGVPLATAALGVAGIALAARVLA